MHERKYKLSIAISRGLPAPDPLLSKSPNDVRVSPAEVIHPKQSIFR